MGKFMHVFHVSVCCLQSAPGHSSALAERMCKVVVETLMFSVSKWSNDQYLFLYYPHQNRNITSFFGVVMLLTFCFSLMPSTNRVLNLELFHYSNQIQGFDVTADTLQSLRWFAPLAKPIWWWVRCINPNKYFLTLCHAGHDSLLPLLIVVPVIVHVCRLWPDAQHTSLLFMVSVAVSSASMETEQLWWGMENEGDGK